MIVFGLSNTIDVEAGLARVSLADQAAPCHDSFVRRNTFSNFTPFPLLVVGRGVASAPREGAAEPNSLGPNFQKIEGAHDRLDFKAPKA